MGQLWHQRSQSRAEKRITTAMRGGLTTAEWMTGEWMIAALLTAITVSTTTADMPLAIAVGTAIAGWFGTVVPGATKIGCCQILT